MASLFSAFAELLDGVKVAGKPISFPTGDVCFVNAIQENTNKKAWMGFVMSAEGKKFGIIAKEQKTNFWTNRLTVISHK